MSEKIIDIPGIGIVARYENETTAFLQHINGEVAVIEYGHTLSLSDFPGRPNDIIVIRNLNELEVEVTNTRLLAPHEIGGGELFPDRIQANKWWPGKVRKPKTESKKPEIHYRMKGGRKLAK